MCEPGYLWGVCNVAARTRACNSTEGMQGSETGYDRVGGRAPSKLSKFGGAFKAAKNSLLEGASSALDKYKTDNTWSSWINWLLRIFTFAAYAGLSATLLSMSANKDACHVQSTYKQEFLTKVVSNPFYSSSQVVRGGPPSMFEVKNNFSAAYQQQASDLGVFPVVSKNPLLHAAFWPVEGMPKFELLAGGSVNITGRDMQDGIYYFDEPGKKIYAKGIPVAGGAGPILAAMALQSAGGPIHAGSVLPNMARCIKVLPENPSPGDVEEWMNRLMHLATHSHMRGTCLLTAQQATVDVTSNYKTSITPFSSVNMLFMLTVVLWISASFALFYIGGGPKPNDFDPYSVPKAQMFTVQDVLVGGGIIWNVILIFILLSPLARNSNVPLNNIVLSIVALLATIMVQWHSAYYTGRNFTGKETDEEDNAAFDQKASFGGNPQGFLTSNFMQVAASSRGSGPKYQMLGTPFAYQEYYQALKARMHLDVVENLEYSITTPLMSAALLASFSPTVPTGMVQLLFVLLLASHILFIPAIYMSNMYKRMKDQEFIHTASMTMAAYCIVGACYMLQVNAIVIKLTFFRQLWEAMYTVDTSLQAATVMVVILQIMFLVIMLMQVTGNVATSWDTGNIASMASTVYMMNNFLLKFVVGCIAFSAAINKSFPAYSCGIWADV